MRQILVYVAYGLGALMVIAGVATLATDDPHPELATLGVSLMLATGLVHTNGKNGNGRADTRRRKGR